MAEPPVNHGTVVVERSYRAPPQKVFAAWSSEAALIRWAVPGDDGWDGAYQRFDFRVGGGENFEFGPKGGDRYSNETLYLDIVENERIVSAGAMSTKGERFFAGLMTAEFFAEDDGCRLKVTEQGAFFREHDKPEFHKAGWNEMFDKLERELGETAG